MSDKLFDTSKPRKPRRMRPRDPLWDWLEARFFSGKVATGQVSVCGKAVKLFAEKGLNVEELERRCKRHVDLWPTCTLTLPSLMKHIDDLKERTPQERERERARKAAELERQRWFEDREYARQVATEAAARCRMRHPDFKPGSQPQMCVDCRNLRRWSQMYGWEYD